MSASRKSQGGKVNPPVVGLIPAAGKARRLGHLPLSKELLPISFRATPEGPVPRLAIHHLLGAFGAAGVERAFVVLDREKTDIPRHLGSGTGEGGVPEGPHLAYVVVPGSRCVPETLAAAAPFVGEAVVALGFPDVLFQPADAFASLLARQAATGADVILGCFPAPDPTTTDMVDLAPDGRVRGIEVRPAASRLKHCWLLAAWAPAFTRLLVAEMRGEMRAEMRAEEVGAKVRQEGDRGRSGPGITGATPAAGELQLGTLFERALEKNLRVEGIPFPLGWFVDLGTPTGLAQARHLAENAGPKTLPTPTESVDEP